jgi:7-carboxy-7-deazaguanine synthase
MARTRSSVRENRGITSSTQCGIQFKEKVHSQDGLLSLSVSQGGSVFTAETLAEEIKRLSLQMHGCKLIVFTGGEPMLQDLASVIVAMRKFSIIGEAPYHFQIETAGTVWPESIESEPSLESLIASGWVTLVCSPKTPTLHAKVVLRCVHWKYILREGETALTDGLPIKSTQIEGRDMNVYRARSGVIYAQPCQEQDEEATEKNTQLAVMASMAFGYRLSLQLHKIVGLA